NRQFVELTATTTKDTGIPIYHETHRGRILYAAPVAYEYLLANPDLRLTLDISHWCVVHESLLADQRKAVQLALSRTDHIHSRVGFQEGPQVPDPRAPEWQEVVAVHFAWWDEIVQQKAASGETLTMTCEFGPPGYMWSLPYTRQPVANLWEVNAHMMRLWRERYA
ncbi:MAG: sugar phosphate isomerase/epimerase, partial [Bacteroidota bacterium]